MQTSEALRMIYEAQQASMQRMLEAWDRELEAQAEAFREAAKQKAAQEVVAAQNAAALEVYLEGLVAQAKGGSDVSVSIPSGIRVAGNLACAPSLAELESLVDEIDATEANYAIAQRSAAWAIGHGMMPHPGDLAEIMNGVNLDAPFASRLSDLAGQLDKIDAKASGHPKLALLGAHDRLSTLQDQVGVMKAYGGERTLRFPKSGPDMHSDMTCSTLRAMTDNYDIDAVERWAAG